jgi:hypothetical protein
VRFDRFDPAAKAAALDQRHGRAGKPVQPVDRGQGAAREIEVLLRRRRAQTAQKGEVGPGLEMPPGAAQHDAAQIGGAAGQAKVSISAPSSATPIAGRLSVTEATPRGSISHSTVSLSGRSPA